MLGSAVRRHAHWCASRARSSEVLDTLLATAASPQFDRTGEFWSAVALAHQQGFRGGGRRIAILDSGFDRSIEALSRADVSRRTKSVTDRSAAHGTAVALLTSIVAPEARLWLADVSTLTRDGPDWDQIGLALEEAAQWSADVICCSLGCSSDALDAPRGGSRARVGDFDADPAEVGGALRAWAAEGFAAFAPGGCRAMCPVCDALDRLGPGKPLVVAAGGNSSTLVECPAAHERTIAAGFRSYSLVQDGDGVLEASGFPSFDQFLHLDAVLDEVPGFAGTSFAAPLLAGFAALVGPPEFQESVVAKFASELGKVRHQRFAAAIKRRDAPTHTAWAGTMAAYQVAFSLMPASHQQHGSPPWPAYPCPLCSLFSATLWQMMGLLLIHADLLDEARRCLVDGSRIAPGAWGIWANLGAVLRWQAKEKTSRLARLGLLLRSVRAYERAEELAPSGMYRRFADETWERAITDPPSLELPAAPLATYPPVPDLGPAVMGLSGAAAYGLLQRAGLERLQAGDLPKAESAFRAVMESDDAIIRSEGALGLGVTVGQGADIDRAIELLRLAGGSEDGEIAHWGRYNTAILLERSGRDGAETLFLELASDATDVVFVDLARVRQRRGDHDGAAQARRSAVGALTD